MALRCCTYNVRNLFLEPAARANAPRKRAAAMRALARTLAAVDADVVLLQEVGSESALLALNARLPEPYPHHVRLPGNSDRGIALAALSRHPLTVTSYADRQLADPAGMPLADYMSEADARLDRRSPLRLQRDLMRCDLTAGATPLTLFNVHLKAAHNPPWRRTPAEQVRRAECQLVAQVIASLHLEDSSRRLLLAGDCNDTWDGQALAPLRELGLVNAARGTDALTPTYWPNRGAAIDHLLLHPGTAPLVLADSFRVHGGKDAQRGSDHYPVSLDLDLDA